MMLDEVRAETSVNENDQISFGISFYGNLEDETAKSLLECKIVSSLLEESLEVIGNNHPR